MLMFLYINATVHLSGKETASYNHFSFHLYMGPRNQLTLLGMPRTFTGYILLALKSSNLRTVEKQARIQSEVQRIWTHGSKYK